MPHINLDTPTGAVGLHYSISTPTSHSSTTITPGLPSILFLHSEYIAQDVFEAQFSDPLLRDDFNLIAIDMRNYGYSTGPLENDKYTPATAADDVSRFLKALDIPPLHIFGLSIGCYVALEFAQARPEHVLSLTLCQHLPPNEQEDTAAGRLEMFDYWEKGFTHDGSASLASQFNADRALLDDVSHGARQLLFSEQSNRLTGPLLANAMNQNMENWAGTPEKLRISHVLCIVWLLERKPFSVAQLSKIKCPVSIIHCQDDIAYPSPGPAKEFESLLREAGNSEVTLHQVSGPRLDNVLNPETINLILRNFVLSVPASEKLVTSRPRALSVDELKVRPKLHTPFTARLVLHGYDPDKDDNASDSDSEE